MREAPASIRAIWCPTGRSLGGLALQQPAADLVSGDQLDGGPWSAIRADPVAADRLTVGAVVQHREHFPLADRAPVGRFRVRLHRSLHDRTAKAARGGHRATVTEPPRSRTSGRLGAMARLRCPRRRTRLSTPISMSSTAGRRVSISRRSRANRCGRATSSRSMDLLEVALHRRESRGRHRIRRRRPRRCHRDSPPGPVRVTLLESDRRKSGFLTHVAGLLGCRGVEVEAIRAEDAGRRDGMRETFDLATSRATAPPPVLCELALPLLRVGGTLCALVADAAAASLRPCAAAAAACGGDAPRGAGARACCACRKVAPTPDAYPRRPGHSEPPPDQLSRRRIAAIAIARSFQGISPAAVSSVFSWPLPAQQHRVPRRGVRQPRIRSPPRDRG